MSAIAIQVTRLEEVRRAIVQRRAQADLFRTEALGNTVSQAHYCLTQALLCEHLAEGMERALSMLVG